jgi:hypothetical protein
MAGSKIVVENLFHGKQQQQQLATTGGENQVNYQKENDTDSNTGNNQQNEDGNKNETGNNDNGKTGGENKQNNIINGNENTEDTTDKNGAGNGGTGGNRNEKETGNGNGNEKENENETATPATNPGHDIKLLQTFTVEFNIRTIPANKIGFIHKEFIKETLTVAPFTTFEASNKRTMPTPTKISTIDQFPSNH